MNEIAVFFRRRHRVSPFDCKYIGSVGGETMDTEYVNDAEQKWNSHDLFLFISFRRRFFLLVTFILSCFFFIECVFFAFPIRLIFLLGKFHQECWREKRTVLRATSVHSAQWKWRKYDKFTCGSSSL